LLGFLAAAALGLVAWVAPRAARAAAASHRARRAAYLQSEAFAFGQLRQAVRRRDAKKTYFALLDWLTRFDGAAPDHTVEALTTAARNPALDRQIVAIENELFASKQDAERWSPGQFLRGVNAARRGLHRRPGHNRRSTLPEELNPVGVRGAPAHFWRKPAR
jgi:hypothetical protein